MDYGIEIDAMLKPRTVFLEIEIYTMLKPRSVILEIEIDRSQRPVLKPRRLR